MDSWNCSELSKFEPLLMMSIIWCLTAAESQSETATHLRYTSIIIKNNHTALYIDMIMHQQSHLIIN